MSYQVHTIESALPSAKDVLTRTQKAFGFVPNLLGVMADAPALLKAYTTVAGFFDETSFTATERQTILLSVSAENGCTYCVAAHSALASMQKVPADVVSAIRDNTPIQDSKLEALRRFARAVVSTRGWPTALETQAFLDAGYAKNQILEVVLGVGLKTLSNYANHIAETPLDQAFEKFARPKPT